MMYGNSKLHVNDLSHNYISPSLCHIRASTMVYWPCGKRHIRADKSWSYDKQNLPISTC